MIQEVIKQKVKYSFKSPQFLGVFSPPRKGGGGFLKKIFWKKKQLDVQIKSRFKIIEAPENKDKA